MLVMVQTSECQDQYEVVGPIEEAVKLLVRDTTLEVVIVPIIILLAGQQQQVIVQIRALESVRLHTTGATPEVMMAAATTRPIALDASQKIRTRTRGDKTLRPVSKRSNQSAAKCAQRTTSPAQPEYCRPAFACIAVYVNALQVLLGEAVCLLAEPVSATLDELGDVGISGGRF